MWNFKVVCVCISMSCVSWYCENQQAHFLKCYLQFKIDCLLCCWCAAIHNFLALCFFYKLNLYNICFWLFFDFLLQQPTKQHAQYITVYPPYAKTSNTTTTTTRSLGIWLLVSVNVPFLSWFISGFFSPSLLHVCIKRQQMHTYTHANTSKKKLINNLHFCIVYFWSLFTSWLIT